MAGRIGIAACTEFMYSTHIISLLAIISYTILLIIVYASNVYNHVQEVTISVVTVGSTQLIYCYNASNYMNLSAFLWISNINMGSITANMARHLSIQ